MRVCHFVLVVALTLIQTHFESPRVCACVCVCVGVRVCVREYMSVSVFESTFIQLSALPLSLSLSFASIWLLLPLLHLGFLGGRERG